MTRIVDLVSRAALGDDRWSMRSVHAFPSVRSLSLHHGERFVPQIRALARDRTCTDEDHTSRHGDFAWRDSYGNHSLVRATSQTEGRAVRLDAEPSLKDDRTCSPPEHERPAVERLSVADDRSAGDQEDSSSLESDDSYDSLDSCSSLVRGEPALHDSCRTCH